MLHLQKPAKSLEFVQEHLKIGKKKGRSKYIELQHDIGDTKCKRTKSVKKRKSKNQPNISMQECRPRNNKNICKTKSMPSNKNTQNIQSSPTSEVVLTTNERASKGFWTSFTNVISKKLWLPQKTDLFASDMSSLSIRLRNLEPESYAKIVKAKIPTENSLRISSLLPPYFPPAFTDLGDIKRQMQNYRKHNSVTYTRKIRFYPTKQQKAFFRQCFGVHRFMYNQAVEYQQETQSTRLNLIQLRKEIMGKQKEKWLETIPYDTRQLAIKDFVGALKAAITNKRNGNIDKFRMGYKSRKDRTQIFNIDKRAIKPNLKIFERRDIGRLRVRSKMRRWFNKHISSIDHNTKILRDNNQRYYLCLTLDKKTPLPVDKKHVVSLDPGLRTFQTTYDPSGTIGSLGRNTGLILRPMARKVSRLQSEMTRVNHRRRYSMHQRCSSLRTKMTNIIADLHWKVANYLCRHYENILLPKFETKPMVAKHGRILTKNGAYILLRLSHYRFRQRLQHKAVEHGSRVIICNEAYTTRTCGNCGIINNNVGASEVFTCPHCKYGINRDINGSRNILLKYLTENFG